MNKSRINGAFCPFCSTPYLRENLEIHNSVFVYDDSWDGEECDIYSIVISCKSCDRKINIGRFEFGNIEPGEETQEILDKITDKEIVGSLHKENEYIVSI